MKIKILMSVLALATLSCKQSDSGASKELTTQIEELKAENKILKDSLSDHQEQFLRSQILLGISDDCILTAGKKNKVAMFFQPYGLTMPQYDIYKVEDGKEIKIGSNTKTRFDYDFTPKSIEDNVLKMKVKLEYNNQIIEYPATVNFKVKE